MVSLLFSPQALSETIMARTFPRQLPNRVRQDPKRRAEVRLYEALQEQLGVGWRIFYSVAWLGRTHADGAPRDGEADFVMAHPAHGILVLEVKGGGIRFDGVLGRWSSTNDEGTYEIKDPFL